MKFLDPNHPMFRQPWVRWVTVLVPLVSGLAEFGMGSPAFGIIFVAAAAYAFYWLIVKGPDQAS